MMNLLKIVLFATLCTSFSIFGLGCGEEVVEAPKPVVKAKEIKEPPKTIVDLMKTHLFDPRIHVNGEEALRDDASRKAMLQFFDAMVKVDAATLKPMLHEDDQTQFDAMVRDGLKAQMDEVTHVDVKVGLSSDGRQCLMGVYEVDMDYQVQVWYFEKSGDGFTFTSARTPPNLANTLRGDWINHFFELQEEMIEIANQPDDDSSYTIFGGSSEGDSDSTGSGRPRPNPGGPRAPTAPGGPLG